MSVSVFQNAFCQNVKILWARRPFWMGHEVSGLFCWVDAARADEPTEWSVYFYSDGLECDSRAFKSSAYITICVDGSMVRNQGRITGQTKINANYGWSRMPIWKKGRGWQVDSCLLVERGEPPALTSCMTVSESDGKGSKKVLEYWLNGWNRCFWWLYTYGKAFKHRRLACM